MSLITTLTGLKADAMTNLYQVKLQLPRITTEPDLFKLRVKDWTPPAASINNYAVHYKTVSFNRPGSKIELDRSFPLSFRVDAYYELYNALKEFQQETFNAQTGEVGASISYGAKITVQAMAQVIGGYDSDQIDTFDGLATKKWIFEDVWCSKVELTSFSQENSAPQEATATFFYGKYTEE